MNKLMFAVVLAFFLTGCAKQPPLCSDASTISLAKKIVLDAIGVDEAAKEKIGKDLLDRILTLENVRASGVDEKIKKLSCEATLVAQSGGADANVYRVPLNFESQLDDKGDHIVAVNGLLPGDMRQIDLFLATAIQQANAPVAPAATAATAATAVASAAGEETPQDSAPAAPAQSEAESASTTGTVETTGVCKGLDLAVTVDQSACISRKYVIADKQLNDEYKRLMASLSVERQAELKSSQRAWIKEKEHACEEAGKEAEGGTLQPILIGDCEVRMTEERNTFLANYR